MKTKRSQLILCAILVLSTVATPLTHAQESERTLPEAATRFSLGGSVNRFHNDFALGVQLTTPYIKNSFAFQVTGLFAFHEGLPENETTFTWLSYTGLKFGTIGVSGMIANCIRLYGTGGLVLLFPNDKMSDDTVIGGYGAFGFEFFMGPNAPVSYYIELGGMGTAASAEKLPGEPIYANGFTATAGLKIFL